MSKQAFVSTLRNLLVFISVLLLHQDLQLHYAALMDQAVRSRNTEKRKNKDKPPRQQRQQKQLSRTKYLKSFPRDCNVTKHTKLYDCCHGTEPPSEQARVRTPQPGRWAGGGAPPCTYGAGRTKPQAAGPCTPHT